MEHHAAYVRSVTALMALGLLAACETGPTEPRSHGPPQAAVAFAELASGELDASEGSACPDGRQVYVERTVSLEKDGEITIRRYEAIARYEECRMDIGWATMTADGEMSWTGESHMAPESSDGDPWRAALVLFETGRQMGFLRLEGDGVEVSDCEYDVEWVNEPAKERFSHKGTACGVTIDRRRS